ITKNRINESGKARTSPHSITGNVLSLSKCKVHNQWVNTIYTISPATREVFAITYFGPEC
ncbi:MAG TPA: hypothetical protein VK616_06185, partial [Flavitalea sp.]|nr:hypothetical protein [Flavitalea sp.]